MKKLLFRLLYAGVLITINILTLFLSQLSFPISLITGISSIIFIVILENVVKPYLEKDNNKISPKKIKKKLIKVLANYESIKNDDIKERKSILELGQLFSNLMRLGFSKDGQHTFKTLDFEIHVTGDLPNISQFLIRTLNNGRRQSTDIAYFSKAYGYDSQINVLNDFINYLKD